jgi:LysM repeat protein
MKIHLPKIFASKPKKKLRATAVRKPLRIAATADYDDLAEPNMKLSRALLIVLLLHVVAVSGIIAFNAIKTHQGAALPVIRPPAVSTDAPAKTDVAMHPAATGKELAHSDTVKATRSPAKSGTKEDRKTDHAKATSAVADSGKTYVVAKGENPLTIAHKFKVSYDDLLAINHIDDARKLQIGQKLIIPAKPKPKKTD